ncbi:MAG: hypothetical protein U1E77_06570 [Inhella sp.]
MKEWLATHRPSDRPAFLFDEVERATHGAITVEAYQTLAAELAAAKADARRAGELAAALRNDLTGKEGECASLRQMVERAAQANSAPAERQRVTFLALIGSLMAKAGKDPSERGAATWLAGITQEAGCPVSDDTIRPLLAAVPAAMERRET